MGFNTGKTNWLSLQRGVVSNAMYQGKILQADCQHERKASEGSHVKHIENRGLNDDVASIQVRRN
jgi:hypothetical protein